MNTETVAFLLALQSELYPSPVARDLKVRIQALNKSFCAREKIRKNSYLSGIELH